MKIFSITMFLGFSIGSAHAQNLVKPCGLSGPVEERILDCDTIRGAFVLVTRSEAGEEVYLDSQTKLLWGDSLVNDLSHKVATNICGYKRELGRKWRLPKIKEFERAERAGIRKTLPNMKNLFWSSSIHDDYLEFSWLFDGRTGEIDFDYRFGNSGFVSARCVTRL